MKIKNLVLTALFAALIFVTTSYTYYLMPISLPGGGYMHLGDSVLMFAALILPIPYAAVAAAIGGALADVMVPGALIWAPFTFVIKGLHVLAFLPQKKQKFFCARNLLLGFLSTLIGYVGYFFATWILTDLRGAVSTLLVPPIQSVGSYLVFAVLCFVFDRTKIKKYL